MATLKTMLKTGLMVGAIYALAWAGMDWLFSTRTHDYATIFAVAAGGAMTTVLWRDG